MGMQTLWRRPYLVSPYPLAILSGILIGTSYIPFPPWAIFFCFVPLWKIWLEEISPKQIFFTGWITQFVLTLIGFNWVSYTVHEFGHMPWWAAFITLALFCSFANLYVPLAGLAWFYFCKLFRVQGAARWWALPIFMSIGERCFPMIFDWHFGYTWLWASFPAFHLADIVGFVGLSNVGLFFNAFLLHALLEFKAEKPRWWAWALSVPVLFGALNLAGWIHSRDLETPDATAKFLVVQANIGNQEKLEAEQGWSFRDRVIDRFSNLTDKGLQQYGAADFVVWPETAFPELMDEPTLSRGYAAKLRPRVMSFHASLITGGYSVLAPERLYTNSFFVISPLGRWETPPYHKTVLLAFGEYAPGGEWFPVIYKWLPDTAHFARGPGPTVLSTEKARLGAQICYEGLFDWFTRALANKGAQIIVNITNDSWYGTWQEPFQHGYMTLARAVEVRRPLIRSTNTGLTAAILASGEILELSPLHEEWFHLYEIPYVTNPAATAFMSWGFWLIPVLLGMGLIGIACSTRLRKNSPI